MARRAMSGLVDRSPAHKVSVSTLWETRSPRRKTRYCTSAVDLRDCASCASTGLPFIRISKPPSILISIVAILVILSALMPMTFLHFVRHTGIHVLKYNKSI